MTFLRLVSVIKCTSIPLLFIVEQYSIMDVDIWIVSNLGLLRMRLPRTFTHTCLCANIFSFIKDRNVEVKSLDNRVHI